MRYRCLVLDHDDTAVNSTPLLHYPAHIEVMKELRPTQKPISLEGWMKKNFSPGIMSYMKEELGFTDTEITREYEIWQDFTKHKEVEFFPGFLEMIKDFHEAGGIVTVVSHSTKEKLLNDYRNAGTDDIIEAVFGWDFDETKRKPHSYPVEQILERFSLDKEDILVLDDLKPAVTMARSAGVAIAGAGWGIQVPEIAVQMRALCDYFFDDIETLHSFLME